MKANPISCHQLTTRRDFLRTSAALASTAALGQLTLERSAHAAGSGLIRIGLIGCGGRGTDAANNAMNAGKDIRLVAMADIFDERLKARRGHSTKKSRLLKDCEVFGTHRSTIGGLAQADR
jgi:hypothetical protein